MRERERHTHREPEPGSKVLYKARPATWPGPGKPPTGIAPSFIELFLNNLNIPPVYTSRARTQTPELSPAPHQSSPVSQESLIRVVTPPGPAPLLLRHPTPSQRQTTNFSHHRARGGSFVQQGAAAAIPVPIFAVCVGCDEGGGALASDRAIFARTRATCSARQNPPHSPQRQIGTRARTCTHTCTHMHVRMHAAVSIACTHTHTHTHAHRCTDTR